MHKFFKNFTNYRQSGYWPAVRAHCFRFVLIDWSNESYFEFVWKYTLVYRGDEYGRYVCF